MFHVLMRIAEDLTPTALACIIADVAKQQENGVEMAEETAALALFSRTQLIADIGENDANLLIDRLWALV